MSENKHTPEPWQVFEDDPRAIVTKENPMLSLLSVGEDGLAIMYEEADARRIVACVNACAGIDTELLEIIEDNDKTLAGVIANVEKQRDELMAENKQLRKDAERYRVLRYSEYQLDEDDPSVSDSFFNQYFGEELDAAVDELKSRFDSAIAIVKGQK